MENRLTRFVYDRSPPLLKDVFASAFGLRKRLYRFGGCYQEWVRFFEGAHRWSEGELRAYQEERLERMIAHCYEHVPYYREMFDRLGLVPSDVRSLEDLPKLPILEKDDVRAAEGRLFSDTVNPRWLHSHPTSGSTGKPLRVYRSRDISNMETAFVWNRYRRHVSPGDRQASFNGLEIVAPDRTRPPFWRNNWALNQRMYSIFHMSDDTLQAYVEDLDRWKARFWAGYASVVYQIADYLQRTGQRLRHAPQLFYAASEELQPLHAQTIREVIGCDVWNRLGEGELVASITQYDCGQLHYDMDFSIIEFQDIGEEDGLAKAEIVGTHIHSYAWPLLRYRTGDLVLYDPNDTCPHGVPGQVVRRIYGRTGHYFVLPDGRRVCNVTVIARKCRNIRNMQVVQERPGEITVRLVPGPDFDAERDAAEVERQFRRKVGRELTIRIVCVDEIERTKAGKYLSIINRTGEGGPSEGRSS